MIRGVLVLALVVLAVPGFAKADLAASRAKRLNRGLNLGAYRYRDRNAVIVTPELSRALWKAGFRHVRLPVDPAWMFDPQNPAALKADGLAKLDGTLDILLGQGFAVSVDMHDPDKRVWNDPAVGNAFVTYWGALAKHLSRRDPERLFLEVANEPLSDNPTHWADLQARCIKAMRAAAPRNTIIASPNMMISAGNWQQLQVLGMFRPVDDTNVVYTFHYYIPFLFTHQGATWSWDGVKGLEGIPYPSSPEAVAEVAAKYAPPQKGYIENYGEERWNAAKIAEDMRPYIEWGKKYNVPVYCGEFGAYRNGPKASRDTWLRDVRTHLEAEKVPWTIWDDGGGFGVTNGQDANLDARALKALF